MRLKLSCITSLTLGGPSENGCFVDSFCCCVCDHFQFWYCRFMFLTVHVLPFVLAEISSMLPDNTYCNGQPIQWMCTSNSSLSWRSRPYSAIYDNDVDKKFNVGLFETELLGIVNGTVFRSTAGISTSRDSSDLNGTLLECAPGGGFEGPEAASVNLTIQGNGSIGLNVLHVAKPHPLCTFLGEWKKGGGIMRIWAGCIDDESRFGGGFQTIVYDKESVYCIEFMHRN